MPFFMGGVAQYHIQEMEVNKQLYHAKCHLNSSTLIPSFRKFEFILQRDFILPLYFSHD